MWEHVFITCTFNELLFFELLHILWVKSRFFPSKIKLEVQEKWIRNNELSPEAIIKITTALPASLSHSFSTLITYSWVLFVFYTLFSWNKETLKEDPRFYMYARFLNMKKWMHIYAFYVFYSWVLVCVPTLFFCKRDVRKGSGLLYFSVKYITSHFS